VVSVIDGATNAILATIQLTGTANPVAIGTNPSTDRIYVGTNGQPGTSVIDGATDAIIQNIPGTVPIFGSVAVNPSTNRIYIARDFSGGPKFDAGMSVVDGASQTVLTTVSFGLAVQGIAVNAATNHVFVSHASSHEITSFDAANNSLGPMLPSSL
jgi:DNA-binding beta-propeller fold protein YncE